MTTNDMIISVKTNLGNRVSGTIGGQGVDTVVLGGISKALSKVLLKYNPEYYNRTCTISLTTADKTYALPTVDTLGNTIRIKDIISFRCYTVDGTNRPLKHINSVEFVKKTADFAQNISGTPYLFTLWEGNLILDYTPTEALTLTMYVESYPKTLTISDVNVALPIEEEWELSIEAYATHYVYLKLQQTVMADQWLNVYKENMGAVPGSVREKHSHGVGIMGVGMSITDPVNNPFVTSWN